MIYNIHTTINHIMINNIIIKLSYPISITHILSIISISLQHSYSLRDITGAAVCRHEKEASKRLSARQSH